MLKIELNPEYALTSLKMVRRNEDLPLTETQARKSRNNHA